MKDLTENSRELRERLTASALSGILARDTPDQSPDSAAKLAITYADAVIKHLRQR